MKLTSILSLALFASASAFAPVKHASFGVPRSATSLNMVADDAKVILVTGSSRGLGKSIALELGKNGQKLVINYVSDGSKEAAEKTCEEIKALGGDAVAIQADSTLLSVCFCLRICVVYLSLCLCVRLGVCFWTRMSWHSQNIENAEFFYAWPDFQLDSHFTYYYYSHNL